MSGPTSTTDALQLMPPCSVPTRLPCRRPHTSAVQASPHVCRAGVATADPPPPTRSSCPNVLFMPQRAVAGTPH
eukprot:337249-Chlamydomonas_euryale.AAC.1